MVVTGHYQLVSAESATLTVSSDMDPRGREPRQAQQQMFISKGKGDFTLIHSATVRGLPHLEMLSAKGQVLAELYFGTQAEALEEGRLQLTNSPPAVAAPAGTNGSPLLESGH
jgi:hypothetical protein